MILSSSTTPQKAASKLCQRCASSNDMDSNYCGRCGAAFTDVEFQKPVVQSQPAWQGLVISLMLSILLSIVLMKLFKLPIFFLIGFLPLFWSLRKKT